MKTISMERIRDLDRVWERERNACLQQGQYYPGPSPFFIQEKFLDAADFRKMSKKWKVPLGELRVFVAVQRYVNAVANNDFAGLPEADDVADQLEIPRSEFKSYLKEQVDLIHAARTEEDYDDFEDWRDVTAEDFGDVVEQLLDEAAAVQGE